MDIESMADNRCYLSGYRSIVYDRIDSVGSGQDFVGQEDVVDATLIALAAGKESLRSSVFFHTCVAQIVDVYEKMSPKSTTAIFASHEVFYNKTRSVLLNTTNSLSN